MSSKAAVNAIKGITNDEDVDYCVRRYNAWLMGGRSVSTEAVQFVIDKVNATDNSKGEGRIRPSMIGKCQRAQVLSYQGADSEPFPRETLNIFNIGNVMHRHWQEVGVSEGWLTDIEVPIEVPNLGVRGSADGLCADGSVFELKTINPVGYRDREKHGPIPDHVNQVQLYMHALEARRASIVYVNKMTYEAQEFRVSYSPEDFSKNLIPQIMAVSDHIEIMHNGNTNLPIIQPEYNLCRKQKGYTYEGCQYRFVCAPELETQ